MNAQKTTATKNKTNLALKRPNLDNIGEKKQPKQKKQEQLKSAAKNNWDTIADLNMSEQVEAKHFNEQLQQIRKY